MEHVELCPLCAGPRRTLFEEIHDARGRVTYHLCRSCGLVYQSPRMDAGELERFYGHEYRPLVQATDEPTTKDLQVQSARARRTLELVRPASLTVTRHLDVGSSSGAVLLQFRELYNCASVGVEPGEAYRQFSQSQALTVYPSLDSLSQAGEKRFDLVSLLHVLEHLPDPVATLKQLRDTWMALGAILLVEVPNLIEHEGLERAHLFGFTAATLGETVRQAGFRVFWTRAHGGFRSPILKLYLTLLARAEPAPVRPIRVRSTPFGIRFLRQVGRAKRRLFTRLFPDWTWQFPDESSRPTMPVP